MADRTHCMLTWYCACMHAHTHTTTANTSGLHNSDSKSNHSPQRYTHYLEQPWLALQLCHTVCIVSGTWHVGSRLYPRPERQLICQLKWLSLQPQRSLTVLRVRADSPQPARQNQTCKSTHRQIPFRILHLSCSGGSGRAPAQLRVFSILIVGEHCH
jgi:hypothetical protein